VCECADIILTVVVVALPVQFRLGGLLATPAAVLVGDSAASQSRCVARPAQRLGNVCEFVRLSGEDGVALPCPVEWVEPVALRPVVEILRTVLADVFCKHLEIEAVAVVGDQWPMGSVCGIPVHERLDSFALGIGIALNERDIPVVIENANEPDCRRRQPVGLDIDEHWIEMLVRESIVVLHHDIAGCDRFGSIQYRFCSRPGNTLELCEVGDIHLHQPVTCRHSVFA